MEGEARFHTGYPLRGSGARDSHRHARVRRVDTNVVARIANSINARRKDSRGCVDWIEIVRPERARYLTLEHNAKRQRRAGAPFSVSLA